MRCSRPKLLPLVAATGLAFGLSGHAWAKPATTLRIPETVEALAPEKDQPWFVRSDVSTSAAFNGATGVGVSAGKQQRFFFIDGSFMYYSSSYGALRVSQTSTPPAGTELARARSDADDASLFSIGGGIGLQFKLFESERWTEMARFGLNYSEYRDLTNNFTFRGPLMNFQFAFGYRIDSFMLAPGMIWNLGFYRNSSVPDDPHVDHKNFLPLQWLSWHLGVYLWL